MFQFQRKVILFRICVLALFVGTGMSQETQQDVPMRVQTVLVNLPVFVTNSTGHNVVGLKREDFKVVINGQNQNVEHFSDGEAQICVSLIVDVSGSTQSQSSRIKKVATTLLDALNERDLASVYTFGDKITQLHKPSSAHVDAKRAIGKLSWFSTGNVFLMNQTITEALTNGFAGCVGKTAIIAISDGGEVDQNSWKSLVATVKEKELVIYSVLIGDTVATPIYENQGGMLRQVNRPTKITLDQLKRWPGTGHMYQLAEMSAGRFIVEAESNMNVESRNIFEELRSFYVLGIYPEVSGIGAPNDISVQVNRNDVIVRTKGAIRISTTPRND